MKPDHSDWKSEIDWYKKNVDIRDYVQANGYQVDKERDSARNRAYTNEQTGDKIFVPINSKFPVANYYVSLHDPNDKGTTVDLIMTREKKSINEARLTLRDFSQNSPVPSLSQQQEAAAASAVDPAQKKRHQYVIDQVVTANQSAADDPLLQRRLLSSQTRHHPAFQDRILINEAPDGRLLAFPMEKADGQVTGLALKNEHTERFIGERKGVWVSNPTQPGRKTLDQVIITEQPIDGQSHFQEQRDRLQNLNVRYYSTAGNPSKSQIETIREKIEQHKPKEIVLANDHDTAGDKYHKAYQEALKPLQIPIREEKPAFRDWNADVYARRLYEARALNRDQAQPEVLHQAHKQPAPPAVEAALHATHPQRYNRLEEQHRSQLPDYYITRPVNGKNVEFSLAEVAQINNDKRLAAYLSLNVDQQKEQGHVVANPAKQGQERPIQSQISVETEKTKPDVTPASVSVERNKKSLDPTRPEGTSEVTQNLSGKEFIRREEDKAIGKHQQVSHERDVLRVVDEPKDTQIKRSQSMQDGKDQINNSVQKAQTHISAQVERSTTSPSPTDFQRTQQEYFTRIDNLQHQVKEKPEYERLSRRLEYYKQYPHLNDKEVDTYLSVEDRLQRNQPEFQQQKQLSKDNSISVR